MEHGPRESVGILFGTEIQTINVLIVPPLVKRCGRLVVFQTLKYGTIDYNFVILQLAAYHPESLLDSVLIDLDLGEA